MERIMHIDNGLQPIIDQIKSLLAEARADISRKVNTTMLAAYWKIGHIIVEQEQEGEIKARYGKRLLTELSKQLTTELGRGFSKSNLYNMREFYLSYQIFQTSSGKLSWSHYIELLSVSVSNGSLLAILIIT
jgi:hypothetical protein